MARATIYIAIAIYIERHIARATMHIAIAIYIMHRITKQMPHEGLVGFDKIEKNIFRVFYECFKNICSAQGVPHQLAVISPKMCKIDVQRFRPNIYIQLIRQCFFFFTAAARLVLARKHFLKSRLMCSCCCCVGGQV